mmetsp:Transcript_22547/g.22372  ORF Transcript_22547/g.22372 Transcript_22547/m.22372 type:complete len:219 (+) Transcript_22547:613-1269(+)|eukprot:CAMPEP_0197003384 /NCGR_PEP_ID=MMETSP1380-20130617/7671_1 /TAXON_ID=5936 /ORGANISM="Euplotes crassus, Strain CT5" /LENGTH=218 /DNA_ID=CAMNT_0042421881 /DNA_START=614 /DNA_END=1270 /DNA_ORIENTATION=-
MSLSKSANKLIRNCANKMSRNYTHNNIHHAHTTNNEACMDKKYATHCHPGERKKPNKENALKTYETRVKAVKRSQGRLNKRKENINLITKALNKRLMQPKQSSIKRSRSKRKMDKACFGLSQTHILEEETQTKVPRIREMPNLSYLDERSDPSPIVSARNKISVEFFKNTNCNLLGDLQKDFKLKKDEMVKRALNCKDTNGGRQEMFHTPDKTTVAGY